MASGRPAPRPMEESSTGFCCCSTKLMPGAVPFGPMRVVTVVVSVSTPAR